MARKGGGSHSLAGWLDGRPVWATSLCGWFAGGPFWPASGVHRAAAEPQAAGGTH